MTARPQALHSSLVNLQRVHDAVGPDKLLVTIVGPIMVRLKAA